LVFLLHLFFCLLPLVNLFWIGYALKRRSEGDEEYKVVFATIEIFISVLATISHIAIVLLYIF
jgi:hypothetical protein